MQKIAPYLIPFIVAFLSTQQCQEPTPFESELDGAVEKCHGTAAILQNQLASCQTGLDSLAVHLHQLPSGAVKKKGRILYQQSIRKIYFLQKSADSLAAFQTTCSDWKRKAVRQKATALLHALIELNGTIEECEQTISEN